MERFHERERHKLYTNCTLLSCAIRLLQPLQENSRKLDGCTADTSRPSHLWWLRWYHISHLYIPSRYRPHTFVHPDGFLRLACETRGQTSWNVAYHGAHVQNRRWSQRSLSGHSSYRGWRCALCRSQLYGVRSSPWILYRTRREKSTLVSKAGRWRHIWSCRSNMHISFRRVEETFPGQFNEWDGLPIHFNKRCHCHHRQGGRYTGSLQGSHA